MDLPSSYGIDLKAQETYNKERLKTSKMFAEESLKIQESITEEEMVSNETFKQATRVVSMFLGEPQNGTDEELVNYGMQTVSDYTIPNTTYQGKGMLGLYKKFENAHPEEKQALWYMLETIENKNITMNGFLRGAESLGKDPTTLAGFAGGWSFFGKKAAQGVVKRKLKEMLFTGGVAGAYTATDEFLRQGIQSKGYDYNKIAEQAGLGAAMGGVLATGLPLAMTSAKWTGQQGLKHIDDIMQGRVSADKNLLSSALAMGRQNIVENTKGVKLLKNSDTGLDLEINGAKVRVLDNKDNTYSPDLSQLESGQGEGSAVYNKLFKLGSDIQMKYKASKDLTPENKIRLPIALLKYRNKVGNDDFTVENIDARVDNLIKTITPFIDKPNASLLTLGRADLKKLSKAVSKKDKDSEGAFISVENLKMLQDYLINKEGI